MEMKSIVEKFVIALLAARLISVPLPMAAAQTAAPSQASPPARSNGIAQSDHPVVLRSSSDLVRIDIEVTDRSGKPVKGLRADQFSITDDGQPQKVSIFSYEDIEAIETATESDTAPIVVPVDTPANVSTEAIGNQVRDRRMLVFFFDLTSMAQDDIQRAHDAAEKFLHQQMTKADLVAVVTFSSNLRVIANFTNDHAVIEKAIAQLVPGVSSGLASPL